MDKQMGSEYFLYALYILGVVQGSRILYYYL